MLWNSHAGENFIFKKWESQHTTSWLCSKQPFQFFTTTNTLFINVFMEKVYCFMLVVRLTFIYVTLYTQRQLMLYLKLPWLSCRHKFMPGTAENSAVADGVRKWCRLWQKEYKYRRQWKDKVEKCRLNWYNKIIQWLTFLVWRQWIEFLKLIFLLKLWSVNIHCE
jgi:hypothetical protein